jgi:hypothetical protein
VLHCVVVLYIWCVCCSAKDVEQGPCVQVLYMNHSVSRWVHALHKHYVDTSAVHLMVMGLINAIFGHTSTCKWQYTSGYHFKLQLELILEHESHHLYGSGVWREWKSWLENMKIMLLFVCLLLLYSPSTHIVFRANTRCGCLLTSDPGHKIMLHEVRNCVLSIHKYSCSTSDLQSVLWRHYWCQQKLIT